MFHPRIPIRVKLSIAIIFIIWLTILILSFVILARQKDQLYLQTVKTGKVSLNYFANNASIPLLKDDLLGAEYPDQGGDFRRGSSLCRHR